MNIYLRRIAIFFSLIVSFIVLVPYYFLDSNLGYRAKVAFPLAILVVILLAISKITTKNEQQKTNLSNFKKICSFIATSTCFVSALVVLLFPFAVLLKKQLTLKDHYWQYSINKYTGGFGLASWVDLYNKDLGPTLLYQPVVVENKLTELKGNYWRLGDVLDSRQEWLLCYLGLKLQGLSDDQILDKEQGKKIILGLIAAEIHPPVWWSEASWLKEKITPKPSQYLNLGVISPEKAKSLVQKILNSQDKLEKQEAFALIYILSKYYGLASQSDKSNLLITWAKITSKQADYSNYNYFTTLGNALTARDEFIDLADKVAINGKLGVTLNFPNDLSSKFKEYYKDVIFGFISLCGYTPVVGDQLTINATLELEQFDVIPITEYIVTEKTVRRSRTTTVGKTRSTTYYDEKVRDVKSEYKDISEKALALVLNINTNEESARLVAPPCGLSISKESVLESHKYFNLANLNNSDKFSVEFYLKNYLASPWQFGVIDWKHVGRE
ncbi:MAG: hypothetical protein J0M03_15530 [Acidobacteria bacterium]|nr:hypothetical protein [Acidobacteriota bacterium]